MFDLVVSGRSHVEDAVLLYSRTDDGVHKSYWLKREAMPYYDLCDKEDLFNKISRQDADYYIQLVVRLHLEEVYIKKKRGLLRCLIT